MDTPNERYRPRPIRYNTITSRGYYRCYYRGKEMNYARALWIYTNGEIPDGMEVDHINGIRTDDRIENLRLVTHRENLCNKPQHRAGRLPGTTQRSSGRWVARCRVGSKQIHIGMYDTEIHAHEAYQTFRMYLDAGLLVF